MSNEKVKGFQGNENKYCVWYQNRSLGRWPVNLHTKSSARNNVCNRGVQESQVSILWNCGLWAHHVVKSRKGVDILHGHDSKTCQRVAYQLCRQQRRYQGRGMKRTIFLLVGTRRTNRQSSRPWVATGMSSTLATRSFQQNCTPRCLHKQENTAA